MTAETPGNLLIIEDEKAIRRFVRHVLEAEGYRLFEAEHLQRGLIEAGTRKPDMVILDLGLPDGDGMDFIHQLRAWSGIPILVLSARVDERDKVAALDAGADDYLVKPFGVGELLARVRASLRRHARAGETLSPNVQFGDVRVDLTNRQVTKAGAKVHLTQIEFRLLAVLLSHPEKVLTHRHLLREVWGPPYVEHSHYLRIYMGHLRQKLEGDPARPRHLITETGIGYRFVPA
ncbi:transcriptional regulator [Rugosibacter aromaticivorans]|uniref:Transcriptional regulator n=1 Tax=Rugosibacter aromaticivorans TaxID=1565605 RepID=A0A0C5J7L8_9PROT|nr:two-component system response regulator KdpE [Rugosibacter aromaticivorans]AJP47609.1 transcriptional regulator [Rugosibacter aromaticivorans]TBR13949.1 MAG: two-component system response regulator KdpE [Rugosibacter sp.]